MNTSLSTCGSAFTTMKVNVRLCGSVPRQDIESVSLRQRNSLSPLPNAYLSGQSTSSESNEQFIASRLCSQLSNYQNEARVHSRPLNSSPEFEAPSWAVPAPGESRLEPIQNTMKHQSAVNLKSQAVFRVGRSPLSDIQLFHDNSSRKHAMLFHHSNGSCYLVDCGSAHGTFVNGVRVHSPAKSGIVVPHRIRKGSIVRFGGPGAPEYILKSFAFELDDLRETPMVTNVLSPTSSMGAVVVHNTRLNSLGKTAKDSLFMSISSKRSFDSVETMDCDESTGDRCFSPPLSPEQSQVRLVSPDLAHSHKRRRVSFCSNPPKTSYPNLISPDLSSDENEDM